MNDNLGPQLRLRLAALRFGARRSARPFAGKAASVWPYGPPLHIARPIAAALHIGYVELQPKGFVVANCAP